MSWHENKAFENTPDDRNDNVKEENKLQSTSRVIKQNKP